MKNPPKFDEVRRKGWVGFGLCFLIAFLALWPLGSFGKPPRVSYSGGDGSSIEKAVVIKAPTEAIGVHAEYEYLAQHFPGYQRGDQGLLNQKGRAYDALEFKTAKGEKKKVYFDITAFFGK